MDYVVGKTKHLLRDSTGAPPVRQPSANSFEYIYVPLASSDEFDRDVDMIMDGLMKLYESELITLINGMLFGDLSTILLIQVQYCTDIDPSVIIYS